MCNAKVNFGLVVSILGVISATSCIGGILRSPKILNKETAEPVTTSGSTTIKIKKTLECNNTESVFTEKSLFQTEDGFLVAEQIHRNITPEFLQAEVLNMEPEIFEENAEDTYRTIVDGIDDISTTTTTIATTIRIRTFNVTNPKRERNDINVTLITTDSLERNRINKTVHDIQLENVDVDSVDTLAIAQYLNKFLHLDSEKLVRTHQNIANYWVFDAKVCDNLFYADIYSTSTCTLLLQPIKHVQITTNDGERLLSNYAYNI